MPSAKILVPISGGKDSQAALELAMSNTRERLSAIAKEFETAIPTDAGLALAAMIREGVTSLGSHIGYAVRSLVAPTLDHSPGNMAQPIQDPAVPTPREVLVGEAPVDRIAAPEQQQAGAVVSDEQISDLWLMSVDCVGLSRDKAISFARAVLALSQGGKP